MEIPEIEVDIDHGSLNQSNFLNILDHILIKPLTNPESSSNNTSSLPQPKKKRAVSAVLLEEHRYFGIQDDEYNNKNVKSEYVDLPPRLVTLSTLKLKSNTVWMDLNPDNYDNVSRNTRMLNNAGQQEDVVRTAPERQIGVKLNNNNGTLSLSAPSKWQRKLPNSHKKAGRKQESLVILNAAVANEEYSTFINRFEVLFKRSEKEAINGQLELEFGKLCYHETSFTLTFNDELRQLGLAVEVVSRIRVKESVMDYNSGEWIKRLKELSQFVLDPVLTEYQKGEDINKLLNGEFVEDDKSDARKISQVPTESMFYDLITSHTERSCYDPDGEGLNIPMLNKKLLGFQKQTLNWMLNHEGVLMNDKCQLQNQPFFKLADDGDERKDLELISIGLDKLSFGWSLVKFNGDNNDNSYWYNCYTGNICSTRTAIEYLTEYSNRHRPKARALLSEEMGLGKTVEVISLVTAHRRPNDVPFIQFSDTFNGGRVISEAKTTLIICPQSIIGQWMQEISDITSSIKVMIYEGIYNYEREDEQLTPLDMANKLSEYDIVLVSYSTVSRELHRAVFKPVQRPTRRCAKRLKLKTTADGELVVDKPPREEVYYDDEWEDKYKDNDYKRIDYSSPLMLLEFWRVVLDEVQMTAKMETNAAKFARIIPRVHSWGVSGTLIKNNLNDLFSLLSFLRVGPIDRFVGTSSGAPWPLIVGESPYYQFTRLFKRISLRHTKKMVSKQIHLPKQSRILLKMPFSVIEKDNYDNLFTNFLRQVGLNERGEPVVEDYDPSRSYSYMRQWLIKLRQVCCHAQLGGSTNSRRARNNTGFVSDSNSDSELILGTLQDVLNNLKKTTYEEILSNERNIVHMTLRKGKIFEFLRQPQNSLKVFEGILPEIEQKMKESEEIGKLLELEYNVNHVRRNSWLELLYQSYFLLASAHYQHYRPMRPIPEAFNEEGVIPEDPAEAQENEKPIEIDLDILNPTERLHYDLENDYYKKADDVLTLILEEPISKSNEAIFKMIEKFQSYDRYKLTATMKKGKKVMTDAGGIQLIAENSFEDFIHKYDIDQDSTDGMMKLCIVSDLVSGLENYGYSIQSQLFYEKIQKAVTQLNTQAHVINYWMSILYSILKVPVTNEDAEKKDDDGKPTPTTTGEEYGDNLVKQELAHTYIEVLQNMLDDRENSLMLVEDITDQKKKNKRSKVSEEWELSSNSRKGAAKVDEQGITNLFLHKKLDYIRKQVQPDGEHIPALSLKNLFIDSQSLTSDFRRYEEDGNSHYSNDFEFLNNIQSSLKAEFDSQRKNFNLLRTKLFDSLNDTFNSKIAYFKALQMKSDIVANYKPVRGGYRETMTPHEKAVIDKAGIVAEISKLSDSVRTTRVRLNYLNTLMSEDGDSNDEIDDGAANSAKDKICVICRGSIIVGTLTSCGHQYCKDCLQEWTKSHTTCPMCMKRLQPSDLYSFTFTRNELQGGLIEEGSSESQEDEKSSNGNNDQDSDGENNNHQVDRDLFKIYKSMNDDILKQIMDIEIKKSYGAKIDMIVKQILYLKRSERDVQILLFSQWSEFLRLLGRALKQNNISYLSSSERGYQGDSELHNVRSWKSRISNNNSLEIDLFKKDRKITCFMLNAHAQAAGLTLTNASHVFLCEPLVNLPLELQAISRIHRIGQVKETKVWNFVILNSVEESIAYLSTKKRLELAKNNNNENEKTSEHHRDRSLTAGEEIDDDVVDSTELTKKLTGLVDKKSGNGEAVSNDDLWASFFAAKSSTDVVSSVVSTTVARPELSL